MTVVYAINRSIQTTQAPKGYRGVRRYAASALATSSEAESIRSTGSRLSAGVRDPTQFLQRTGINAIRLYGIYGYSPSIQAAAKEELLRFTNGMPDGSADRLGHFLCTKELWSGGAVALSGVTRGIHQYCGSNSRDILVRWRRIATVAIHPGKHSEIRCQSSRHKIVVSEEPRIYDRMCNTRRH